MRQIDVFVEVFREWGSWILRGLRLCLSVMNFFEVRMSHTGSAWAGPISGDTGSATRRFLVIEEASFFCASVLICLRSALEALRTCLNQ